MSLFLINLLAASAIAFAPVPSSASDELGGYVDRMRVSYRDLDVAQTRDAAKLLRRISQAAEDVCGGRQGLPGSSAYEEFAACQKQAMLDAVRATRSQLLEAMLSGTPIQTESASR